MLFIVVHRQTKMENMRAMIPAMIPNPTAYTAHNVWYIGFCLLPKLDASVRARPLPEPWPNRSFIFIRLVIQFKTIFDRLAAGKTVPQDMCPN